MLLSVLMQTRLVSELLNLHRRIKNVRPVEQNEGGIFKANIYNVQDKIN